MYSPLSQTGAKLYTMASHPVNGPFDLQAFRKGNVKVFAEVFSPHIPMIYLMAFSMFKDKSEAESVVAEMRERLWRNRMIINNEKHVRAFLVIATRNFCIDKIRAEKRERANRTYYAYWKDTMDASEEDLVFHEDQINELRRLLTDDSSGMPQRCREVVHLRFFMGMEFNQIAERLGVPTGTIYTRWKDAKAFLAASLKAFRNLVIIIFLCNGMVRKKIFGENVPNRACLFVFFSDKSIS
jgi:RNA polymerase sigma-70 factor (ECF subfamily)